LNKGDLVDPSDVNQREKAYSELLDFDRLIWVSAITQEGRSRLFQEIIQLLPEGPKYYPEEQITTTYEREIAEDLIRAAALNYLRDEVPYGIFVRVNDYKKRSENLRYVHATIFVENESHKGIVIGRGGRMIKKISTMARQETEEMSGEKIYLDLKVKVKKNWRNDPDFLRRYGLRHD
jgi:GTPase